MIGKKAALVFVFAGGMGMTIPGWARNVGQGAIQWAIAGTIPGAAPGKAALGLAGPVTGISGDRLLVGGGTNFPHGPPWKGGTKQYYRKVYVYQRMGRKLALVNRASELPYAVAYAANVSTPKGVIVVGGQDGDGALRKVSRLSWSATAHTLKVRPLPELPQPLTDGMAAVVGDTLFFAGGENRDRVSDALYALTLDSDTAKWRLVSHLPQPTTHALLLAARDAGHENLYLVGGRDRQPDGISKLYSSVYAYDIASGKWSRKASLPYVLSAQTGIAWRNRVLMVFSGDRGKTFHATQELMSEIARAPRGATRDKLVARKNHLQETHPGFDRHVLIYDIAKDSWRDLNPLPFPGQVTTTAVRWGDDVVIPGGEVRAGVRTADIALGEVHDVVGGR